VRDGEAYPVDIPQTTPHETKAMDAETLRVPENKYLLKFLRRAMTSPDPRLR